MDPALQEQLLPNLDPNEEIAALIRLKDPAVIPAKLRLVTQFGEIITCRIKRKDVLEIYYGQQIVSFKASRFLTGDVVETEEIEEEELQIEEDWRLKSQVDATGKGVVIGIIDYGADFAHVDFIDKDGSTRLIAIWDQTDETDINTPKPFNYGRVYHRDEINSALASDRPYHTLGYHPGKSAAKGGSHGTHVMGIAAGNGRSGAKGIAPEAEIIFVHLSSRDVTPTMNLGDSVSVLEAIHFIQKTAGDQPLVINLSFGRHGGSHEGLSLIEMGMDNFLANRMNTAICQSTGNYFESKTHTSGIVPPGRKETFKMQIDKADITPNELEIWYSGKDIFDIILKQESSDATFSCPLGGKKDILWNNSIIGRIYHRANEPNNQKNHINIFLYTHAPKGKWTVELMGVKVVDGRYHAWIERDSGCKTCQSKFEDQYADPLTTTGTICNGFNTIVVGAINTKTMQLAPFSSSGPTVDGRQKPNVLAPGVGVVAARSSALDEVKGGRRRIKMSGTSMATPHVTGAVALILETTPLPLSSFDIRTLLLKNADPSFSENNHHRIGNGVLDISQTLTNISQKHLKNSDMSIETEKSLTEQYEETISHDEGNETFSERVFQSQTPHYYTPASTISFNCHPPKPYVNTVSQFPNIVANPETIIEQAFSNRGIAADDIARFRNNGGFAPLLPIAQYFGDTFAALLAQLRYPNNWIMNPRVTYHNRDTPQNNKAPYLAPRLLLAIPGFFRELARNTTNSFEAYSLENLGWLLMYRLRDLIQQNTNNNWWLPPRPVFIQEFPPLSLTYVSTDITDYVYFLNLYSDRITQQAFRDNANAWRNALAGQHWLAETGQIPGLTAGLLFYPNLVTIPAAVNTQTQRQQIDSAWQARLAQVDQAFPISPGATPQEILMIQQQRMQSLTAKNQPNPSAIAPLFSAASFGNVKLAYEYPQLVNTANPVGIRRQVNVLKVLVPVVEAVFRTVEELGWNDLLFHTMGGQLFRGIGTTQNNRESVDAFIQRAYPRARGISNHAYGLALDLNFVENPQETGAHAAMAPRLVALFEAFGFRWGYCFNHTDGHHFEYAGNPIVVPAFTTGPQPAPFTDSYYPSEYLENGYDKAIDGHTPGYCDNRHKHPQFENQEYHSCKCSQEEAKDYVDVLSSNPQGELTTIESGGGTGKKLTKEAVQYLSFEGGGGKGLIYVGAIKALENLGILRFQNDKLDPLGQIKGVAGASAGAITATLLSIGYNSTQIQDALSRTNLNRLFDLPVLPSQLPKLETGCAQRNDIPVVFIDFLNGLLKKIFEKLIDKVKGNVPIVLKPVFNPMMEMLKEVMATIRKENKDITVAFMKKLLTSSVAWENVDMFSKLKSPLMPIYINNFVNDLGLFSGCNARAFFAELIRKKTGKANLTFEEHYDRYGIKLRIVGFNVEKSKVEYFSKETTPNMSLVDAIRISMSLPYIYKPIRITKEESLRITKGGIKGSHSELAGLWLDGGTRNNSPIRVFENEPGANPKTLGIRLGYDQDEVKSVDSIFDLILRYTLIPGVMGTGETGISSTSGFQEQTIELNAGNMEMWDFKPDPKLLKSLVSQAEKDVCKYFDHDCENTTQTKPTRSANRHEIMR